MFRVHCPEHGHDVLLGYGSIEAVVNTDDGIELRWRCHCGARGTMRTGVAHVGRAAPEAPLEPAPSPVTAA